MPLKIIFEMKIFFEKILIFFAILVIIAVSCTERIDIKTNDAPSRVVIYGYITSDTTQHSIRITRSAGYFTTDRPEGISNAIVTITNDNGNVIHLAECDETQGLYLTAPDVYGEEGKTYRLDVMLDTGEHYQASAYLQHINHIDSVGLRLSPFLRNTVEVLLYAQDLGHITYYSIFVAINDSVVNPTINRFFIMDNVFFRGQYINGVECFFLNQSPNHEFRNEILHVGDKVTLNINAISEEYANFITAVQSEIRGSNPIFGGPPANVPTNIRRIYPKGGIAPVGFFTAFPRRYAYTIVTEDFSVKN